MTSSRAAVLDCGASHAAFGVLVRDGRDGWRLEQLAVETFAVEPGREAEWAGALRHALGVLRARVAHRGPVLLVLPGHLVLTKAIRTPCVEAAKRDKIVHFEARQNIPYALADVVWDHVVTGGTDMDLEIMLCAAKLEAVEALCAAVEQAGFTPSRLVPGALALPALYRDGGGEAASLLVNLGARTTTLAFCEAARVQVRSLALGGNWVTQRMMESQDCDFPEAERLKLSERNPAILTPATEAFVVRLAQEITRSVLHFRRHGGTENPRRVLLTGGSAGLPGLEGLLAAKLNVPVGLLDVFTGSGTGTSPVGAAEHGAIVADLVGVGLRQLREANQPPNLLPPRLRTREAVRRRRPWLAAAAVLVTAALLPPVLHFRELAEARIRKAAEIAAEVAPLREREARNRANLERLAVLQERIAALEMLHARRDNWLAFLADLQGHLVQVEDVWLERLQLAPSAPEPGAPLRLAISGRMLDKGNPLARVSPGIYERVTALLGSLSDSPYVSGVEGERFDNRQPGILHFDFVLVAEPQRPL